MSQENYIRNANLSRTAYGRTREVAPYDFAQHMTDLTCPAGCGARLFIENARVQLIYTYRCERLCTDNVCRITYAEAHQTDRYGCNDILWARWCGAEANPVVDE